MRPPTIVAVLLVIGGVGLLALSITRRWVNWLSRRSDAAYWFVQTILLFLAVWGLFKGISRLSEDLK